MKDKKMSLVDPGKLFFAICVLGIHTHAFPDSTIVHSYIFALAVPFFFICSGYFLGAKIGRAADISDYRQTLKKYGRHLAVPYIIWGVWYFCLDTALKVVSREMTFSQSLKSMALRWLVTSPGGGLWYIQAILIIILLMLITDKKSYRIVLTVIFVGLSVVPSVAVIPDQGVLKLILESHTFLWDSLYFLAGILIGEKGTQWLKRNICICVFAVTLLIKVVLLANNILWFNRIVNMIMAAALFGILFGITASVSYERSLQIRRWSTIIYFTHMTVKYGVNIGLGMLKIDKPNIGFAISLIILLIYAVVVDKYARNKKIYKLLYAA